MKARDLIVVPRMPARPREYTGHPFTTLGDVVADCGVAGCGYHAMGSRADVKQAMDEHHRMYHSQETAGMVLLLNHPRQ